jgi:hypothetical protein
VPAAIEIVPHAVMRAQSFMMPRSSSCSPVARHTRQSDGRASSNSPKDRHSGAGSRR